MPMTSAGFRAVLPPLLIALLVGACAAPATPSAAPQPTPTVPTVAPTAAQLPTATTAPTRVPTASATVAPIAAATASASPLPTEPPTDGPFYTGQYHDLFKELLGKSDAEVQARLDKAWFAADPWQVEQSNRWLNFFYGQGLNTYVQQYTLDGKPQSSSRPDGLVAINGAAALAASTDNRSQFVAVLWNLPLPTGQYRYYEGMLILLSLLHASGHFQIYAPAS